jgi:hypothetical protein
VDALRLSDRRKCRASLQAAWNGDLRDGIAKIRVFIGLPGGNYEDDRLTGFAEDILF